METCREKEQGQITPNNEKGHFERNLSLQFHILHSLRSDSYLKTI